MPFSSVWAAARRRAQVGCQCRLRHFSSSDAPAISSSWVQRPGSSRDDVLLVGVGAEPRRQQFEEHVTSLLLDVAPTHVVLELSPEVAQDGSTRKVDSSLLLREVDKIIEQVVRQATFGFGSVPEGAGMDSYRALFWALGLTPQEEMAMVQQIAVDLRLPLVQADATTDSVMSALRDTLNFSELQSMLQAASTSQGQELLRLNQALRVALPKSADDEDSVRTFLEAIRPLQERGTITTLVDALGQIAPAMSRVVIDARAAILGSRLLELDGTTVAVVGLAQMDGVETYLQGAGANVSIKAEHS